jgi:uncharacterized membrane protein
MFQLLFKYPAAVFAKGKLVLLGAWPVWLMVVAMVLSAIALAFLLRRAGVARSRAITLWSLQAATVILLLLLLWEPAISITTLRPQQNIVAVLVDTSQSMGLKDSGPARLEQAKRLLESRLLPDLRQRYQVRLYSMGETLNRLSQSQQLQPAAPATRINAALHQIADEAGTLPIGAIAVLTDGADTTGGIDAETMAELHRRRLPVNAIGFGRESISRDLELESFDITPKALTGSRVDASIRLRQSGFAGQDTKISVTSGGQVLASRAITLADAPEQIEHLDFSAGKEGIKNLEATVEPLDAEVNKKNNRLTSVMHIDGKKRRILYVEGEPRWEYKFLRRAVEDDPAITVISMLRTTQNKIYRQGISAPSELADGFPLKPEELFGYDGLVLGSVEAGFFNAAQQAAMRDFVDRRGAGILFLGGRSSLADGGYNAQPFAELLPVNLPHASSTFQRKFVAAELTAEGKRSLLCRIEDDPEKSAEHWDVLPYLADYQDAGAPKPGAVVLANVDVAGRKLPLLVTENYGAGRTGVFATGGSWRWRMQQPVGDVSQQTFWRQLLRWTVEGTPTRVTAVTSLRQLEDEGGINLRANVKDALYSPLTGAQVQAVITNPQGRTETIAFRSDPTKPGSYDAKWDAHLGGSYMAEVIAMGRDGKEAGRDVLTFRRDDGLAENFHQEQNRELLQKLATETGGHYYTPGSAPRLPDEIAFSDAGISSHELRDVWNMPIVFLLLLSLRVAEWGLRRKWGII